MSTTGTTTRQLSGWLVLVAAMIAGGCGTQRGEVFTADGSYIWPAPPAQPRLRYIGELTSSDDLKPQRTLGQRLGSALFGRAEARAMVAPMGVCTDGADRVFVADSQARVVHVFDLDSRRYEQWVPDDPESAFITPVGVAWGRSDRLYVADSTAGVVHIFDGRGQWRGTIGDGDLDRPTGVALHPSADRVYVADAGAHRVAIFTPEGELVGAIGSRGPGLGEFNFPTNLAFGPGGRLYVSDTLNFRVQVFSADGEAIRQIGSEGDTPGYFGQPKGVAVSAEGVVYVVDARFEAVQLFNADGDLLMSLGDEGHGPGQFWLPAGIHTSADGRVWVADSYNKRVQVFEPVVGEDNR